MKTSVSVKRCPGCGKATRLQAANCSECGHRFRTRFVEPIEKTQVFSVVMLPRTPVRTVSPAPAVRPVSAAQSFRRAFLSSFLLVACAGSLLWLAWSVHRPQAIRARTVSAPAVPPSISPATADPSPPDQAQHLYKAIGIAMSLYELDQTAGGTGRVIRVPDPHTLLLSYDYRDRSVRVSLNRADVTSDDYRVETVALYQGKTLLQQHTELE